MIDFHTHILPDVDDGVDSVNEALSAAENAVRQGIKKIVATPHYLEDGFRLTPAETRDRVARLQSAVGDQGLNIEILPGAEIYITPDLATRVSDKDVITINDSRYVLLELPPGYIPDYTDRVLYNLKAAGYIPVIAHPERYRAIVKDPNHLYHWAKNKVYAQLNAGSLMGIYGSSVKETAKVLIEHNLIHFLGSDLHSDGERSKSFIKALNIIRKISNIYAEKIIKNNELAVKDEEIKVIEPQKCKKDNFTGKLKKIIRFN